MKCYWKCDGFREQKHARIEIALQRAGRSSSMRSPRTHYFSLMPGSNSYHCRMVRARERNCTAETPHASKLECEKQCGGRQPPIRPLCAAIIKSQEQRRCHLRRACAHCQKAIKRVCSREVTAITLSGGVDASAHTNDKKQMAVVGRQSNRQRYSEALSSIVVHFRSHKSHSRALPLAPPPVVFIHFHSST